MSGADVSVVWVDKAADIDPALWQDCFPPPLEGRWWYETLEGSGLEDQFRFLYGVVSVDGRAVAIAPAFRMDMQLRLVMPPLLLPAFDLLVKLFPPLRYQRTLFVGSPCADEGHVGMLPGADRSAVLRALQTGLQQQVRRLGASMLVWKDFPAAWDADFERLAQSARLFRVTSFPGTVATLPGPGREDYLAALSSMRRHNLKKKWRRSRDNLALAVEVRQAPDAATLDAVFGLFQQTYEKATTRFERLDRRFFELIARLPQAHFILLRAGESGELVAFMLCFEADGYVINKFIGIDYARPRECFLYFRLWEAALDWALSRGATAIQSGQTGYRAKLDIGHRLQPLTNHCRHRHTLVHLVYALLAKSVSWETLDPDLARHLQAHPQKES